MVRETLHPLPAAVGGKGINPETGVRRSQMRQGTIRTRNLVIRQPNAAGDNSIRANNQHLSEASMRLT